MAATHFSQAASLLKNGSLFNSGDKRAKESALLCDHDFSPIRMNRLRPADSLLKESSSDKTYMTLIQEINDQWSVLLL